MKIEKLDDLLTLDTDKLKSAEKSRVITKIKQLIKGEGKAEKTADSKAEDFPYKAISVVGNELVYVAFDLETKEARVVGTETDDRDTKGRNHMVTSYAVNEIKILAKTQKEK